MKKSLLVTGAILATALIAVVGVFAGTANAHGGSNSGPGGGSDSRFFRDFDNDFLRAQDLRFFRGFDNDRFFFPRRAAIRVFDDRVLAPVLLRNEALRLDNDFLFRQPVAVDFDEDFDEDFDDFDFDDDFDDFDFDEDFDEDFDNDFDD